MGIQCTSCVQCNSNVSSLALCLGILYARCTLYAIDFGVSHGGHNDITSHLKSKRHKDMSKPVPSTTPIISLFQIYRSDQAIDAEVRWATFVT